MNKTGPQHFRSCFELYSKTVYAVAFSMMKNSADANDIMQEVFLKFYQNMDKLTNDCSLPRKTQKTATQNAKNPR